MGSKTSPHKKVFYKITININNNIFSKEYINNKFKRQLIELKILFVNHLDKICIKILT